MVYQLKSEEKIDIIVRELESFTTGTIYEYNKAGYRVLACQMYQDRRRFREVAFSEAVCMTLDKSEGNHFTRKITSMYMKREWQQFGKGKEENSV